MKTIASFDSIFVPAAAGLLGSLGVFLQQIFTSRRGTIAKPVSLSLRGAALAEYIKSEPVLHTWVLALGGKSSRVQRALLVRAERVLRQETSQDMASKALAQLTDPALLRAVLAALEVESIAA